jgi:hypothetical protein
MSTNWRVRVTASMQERIADVKMTSDLKTSDVRLKTENPVFV